MAEGALRMNMANSPFWTVFKRYICMYVCVYVILCMYVCMYIWALHIHIDQIFMYACITVTANITDNLLNTKVLTLVSRRLSQPVQSPTTCSVGHQTLAYLDIYVCMLLLSTWSSLFKFNSIRAASTGSWGIVCQKKLSCPAFAHMSASLCAHTSV